MTDAPISLEIRDLTKVYDGAEVEAVRPTSFALAPGEFFSLLGPSGCGKSTTLRMIAGLEAPTSGTILLDGEDITAVPPERRDVNLVFQGYALFTHLSVADNVAFGLRRKRVSRTEIRSRVAEALDLVALEGLDRRRPSQLSGGQQQRVALARALVNRPRVLLLDEPLGALDLQLRESMQLELGRIQRETGITFVYVTHDQGEALSMSDRVAVVNEGRIEQVGPPREIYRRPATRFVASFIGVSNVLEGTVRQRGVDVLIDTPPGARVTLADAPDVRVGDHVAFSVRPEQIELASSPRGDSHVAGEIVDVAYHGALTRFLLRTELGVDLVAVRADDDAAPALGERWWACWSGDAPVLLERTPPAPLPSLPDHDTDQTALA